MNKKGFTLVELLAVIVILALVAVITIPLISRTINSSKDSLSNRQVDSIEKASENWFLKQSYSLSADSNKYYVVQLQTLIQDGYLDKNKVVDPTGKTGVDTDGDGQKEMQGCVYITYEQNQYRYKYHVEGECSCDSSCEIIPQT